MNIGTLSVSVMADTKRFDSGLKQARTTLGGFVSKIGAAQAAVGALAAGAMVQQIRASADLADELDDAATKLRLNVESLQALRFAADQSGGSARAFDTAMGFLEKTVGKAAIQGGAAADNFARLGLDVKKLQDMKPDQMFLAVLDSLKAIPDESERMAAITQTLGRNGAELMGMIQGGSEGVLAAAQKLAANGGIIPKEDIERLGPLADKLAELNTNFNSLKTSVFATFGPAFIWAVDKAIGVLNNFRKAQLLLKIGLLEMMNEKGVGGNVRRSLNMFAPGSGGLVPVMDTTSDLKAARQELKEFQEGKNPLLDYQKDTAKESAKTNDLLQKIVNSQGLFPVVIQTGAVGG